MSLGSSDYCFDSSGVHAVDTSQPVTKAFLNKMGEVGVRAIIRYYDYVDETIKGKTLSASELKAIRGAGFETMVVFQHNNNKFSTFEDGRGSDDAERCLELAAQFGQPEGSAIYFGVDGDWPSKRQIGFIEQYFVDANNVFTSANSAYAVGVYGSGFTCDVLKNGRLVTYCWLANATGWTGYDKFLASKSWQIRQLLPGKCGGREVDFNFVGDGVTDFGQFS